MPPLSLSWLTWIALLPLFVAVRRASSAKEAANLGLLCGFAFYAISLHWFWNIFGVGAIPMWCLLALFPVWFCAVAWRLRRALISLLVWPTLWTGIEYFRCEIWPLAFPWLSLGSGLWADPTAHLARWIGVYGLSLLACAVSVGLSFFVQPNVWAKSGGPLIAALLVIAVRVSSGRISIPVPAPTLKVALVQTEGFEDDRHARFIRQAGWEGAKVVLLPEYSVFLPGGAVNEFTIERYQALARQTSSYLVLGCVEVDNRQTRGENYALVLEPGGDRIARYAKRRTVPFVEKLIRPGAETVTFPTPAGRLGLQICYDFDFSDGARRLENAGAILVPSMFARHWGDWPRRQHVALTALRALESGRWVAKACSSGESVIVDPAGRIRERFPVDAEGLLLGRIGMASGQTPYAAGGWFLAPVCMVLAGMWSLLAVLRRLE